MKLVALGGGIGAGKSTVSAMLGEWGAVIVDADLIARQVVEPDGSAYGALVERFGDGILQSDKTLNRAALAAIVFPDPEQLQALNAITRPAINAEIIRRVDQHRGSDKVVIIDAALAFETGRNSLSGRMVVDVEAEVAVRRLIEFRNFAEHDARARVAAQITREERNRDADLVIDNSRDRVGLEAEVDRAWKWIASLEDSKDNGS